MTESLLKEFESKSGRTFTFSLRPHAQNHPDHILMREGDVWGGKLKLSLTKLESIVSRSAEDPGMLSDSDFEILEQAWDTSVPD